jgi:broad specificity phosphatase PhoE
VCNLRHAGGAELALESAQEISRVNMLDRVYLIRHGETEWSVAGKHTGRCEIPLTSRGEHLARALGRQLRSIQFSSVLTSPRERARRTCELAGLRPPEIEPDLAEWDYGSFEGMTTAEIRKSRANWNLFRDGCPGGESPEQISQRADRLIARLKGMDGNIAIFSHGHFLRVLAARWTGMPVEAGQHLVIGTASIGILGFEHDSLEEPAIVAWNCLHDDDVESKETAQPNLTHGDGAAPAIIDLHLRELNQLFDSLDNSPFREKDLDRNAEEYIVDSLKEFPAKALCKIIIHLDRPMEFADEPKMVEEAIRIHFARQTQVIGRRLRRLIRIGTISLLIGLCFLASFFGIGQLVRQWMGETQLASLVREGLLIGGWVAMWKPIEIFLYDWWPILSERRIHERLSQSPVTVVYAETNPTRVR